MEDYQAKAYNENAIIEMLQDVDGETMEAIIRAVGMEDQILRQLIMTMPMSLVEELVEEKALMEFRGYDDEEDIE